MKVQKEYHLAIQDAQQRKDRKTVALGRRYISALEGMMKQLLPLKRKLSALGCSGCRF